MSAPQTSSRERKLRSVGIRHFDDLIHDQSREWLQEKFSRGARKYPINVSMLMRNVIWQVRERIIRGEKPALNELVRTFWYMFIKPTLSRAGALAQKADQYKQLVEQFVYMIKELQVMRYADFGFRDDNEVHRRVGANANIILFSEKLGHQSFLSEMADQYQVSSVALGGQPSVLNVEYFVNALKVAGVDVRRSFYLFSIVDYDPSGWIIRDSFVNDLRLYGIRNTRVYDLITPDMLTIEEVQFSRYRVPAKKGMLLKNQRWLKEVTKRKYANQKYLEGRRGDKKVLYGLEGESISAKRLEAKLKEVMVPLLGKSEDLVTAYELRKLNKVIQALMLFKMIGSL